MGSPGSTSLLGEAILLTPSQASPYREGHPPTHNEPHA
jgi:hypothetical protein